VEESYEQEKRCRTEVDRARRRLEQGTGS